MAWRQPPLTCALCGVVDKSFYLCRRNLVTEGHTQVRQVLADTAAKLGVTELSQWYPITLNQIKRVNKRGWAVLSFKYPTLRDALMEVYPSYPWNMDAFKEKEKASVVVPSQTVPINWKDPVIIVQELKKAETKLGIIKPEDWYSITLTDLRGLGFPQHLRRGELAKMLEKLYPNKKWDWGQLSLLKGRLARQKRLYHVVSSLFGGEVKFNVRKEGDLINPTTGGYLELDVYVPEHKLAFEYQEQHHYKSSDLLTGSKLEDVQFRDKMKVDLAKQKGITLITIPWWWDGTPESVIATIKKVRPELLPEAIVSVPPIPEEIPQHLNSREITKEIEDIGEPTSATFFTLSKINPTGWLLFEKYDGVRGFWNPKKKTFFSRTGKRFQFPQHIVDAMPSDIFLDGELWFGRDNFQESLKISARLKHQESINWANFKYMVYDVPDHKGTYSERYNYLCDKLANGQCQYIEIAQKEECKDMQHLEQFFQNVIDMGGEGVILRDPAALLQPGRSPGYLKHKKYRDAEARIVGSSGPLEWECELPNGVRFTASAGTTEFARKWQPKEGDIVSFKHHGFLFTSGKPKFAALYRMRPDLSWTDVVNNWKEQKSKPSVAPWPSLKKRSNWPKGYWRDMANVRQFFDRFAASRQLNPLYPETWYYNLQEMNEMKEASAIRLSCGGLKKAVMAAYPELDFVRWRRKEAK